MLLSYQIKGGRYMEIIALVSVLGLIIAALVAMSGMALLIAGSREDDICLGEAQYE